MDEPLSPSARPRISSRSLFWLTIGVAVAALAVDLFTKAWALANLTEKESVPLVGNFIRLQLIHNPGAAFSLGEGVTWIFTLLSAGVLVLILWYARTVTSVPLAIILGFLAGGAAGNLWDRLTRPPGFARGHVVDFIDYNGWFIGNVADIWIVGAVVALVIVRLVEKDPASVEGGRRG